MIKKTLCLFIVLTAIGSFAQRFLVRLSNGNPDIPDGWPIETSNPLPSDVTNVVMGWETNWTVDELRQRITVLRPDLEARQKTAMDANASDRKTRLERLESLFDDFKNYGAGWTAGTNYSNARLNKIVEDHNRAFLILRPILRDLYQSRE